MFIVKFEIGEKIVCCLCHESSWKIFIPQQMMSSHFEEEISENTTATVVDTSLALERLQRLQLYAGKFFFWTKI